MIGICRCKDFFWILKSKKRGAFENSPLFPIRILKEEQNMFGNV